MPLTPQDRLDIRNSNESVRALAQRYDVSPTTIQKWRGRLEPSDRLRLGYYDRLAPEQIATLILLRRAALLSLDDALPVARRLVPKITRSSLYRLWRDAGLAKINRCRRDIAMLERRRANRMKGHCYVTVAVVPSKFGLLQISVGIDRSTRVLLALITQGDGRDVPDELASLLLYHPALAARSVLLDAPLGHSFKIEVTFAATNASAPWTPAQLAKSDELLRQRSFHCDSGRSLHFLQPRLESLIAFYNDSPLKALAGKQPSARADNKPSRLMAKAPRREPR